MSKSIRSNCDRRLLALDGRQPAPPRSVPDQAGCPNLSAYGSFPSMISGLSRVLIRRLAQALAGMLLFANLAVAAHACQAAMYRGQSSAMLPPSHCHEAPATDPGALCSLHCSDEQSPTSAAPGVAPMPAIAVLVVPTLAPAQQRVATGIGTQREVSPALHPPPSILFHAFRS